MPAKDTEEDTGLILRDTATDKGTAVLTVQLHHQEEQLLVQEWAPQLQVPVLTEEQATVSHNPNIIRTEEEFKKFEALLEGPVEIHFSLTFSCSARTLG